MIFLKKTTLLRYSPHAVGFTRLQLDGFSVFTGLHDHHHGEFQDISSRPREARGPWGAPPHEPAAALPLSVCPPGCRDAGRGLVQNRRRPQRPRRLQKAMRTRTVVRPGGGVSSALQGNEVRRPEETRRDLTCCQALEDAALPKTASGIPHAWPVGRAVIKKTTDSKRWRGRGRGALTPRGRRGNRRRGASES